MTNKKKRSATAIRTARSNARYRDAGLEQIKVWTHPDEKEKVRKYAAKNPLTKAIRSVLKDG